MQRTAAIMLLIGLALFTAVLVWQGLSAIGGALSAAGWGLALVAAWHLLPLIIDSHAWRILYYRSKPRFARIVWARWIGESINGLLIVYGDLIFRRHVLADLLEAPGEIAVLVDSQWRRVDVVYITGHWLDVNDLDDLRAAYEFAYGNRSYTEGL